MAAIHAKRDFKGRTWVALFGEVVAVERNDQSDRLDAEQLPQALGDPGAAAVDADQAGERPRRMASAN